MKRLLDLTTLGRRKAPALLPTRSTRLAARRRRRRCGTGIGSRLFKNETRALLVRPAHPVQTAAASAHYPCHTPVTTDAEIRLLFCQARNPIWSRRHLIVSCSELPIV